MPSQPCLHSMSISHRPVRAQVLENDDKNVGYNAATGTYEDLLKAGIIDPVKARARSLFSRSRRLPSPSCRCRAKQPHCAALGIVTTSRPATQGCSTQLHIVSSVNSCIWSDCCCLKPDLLALGVTVFCTSPPPYDAGHANDMNLHLIPFIDS